MPFEGQPHRTSVLSGPVPRLPPNDLALVLSVYCRAAAALEIPQDEIRRDYLAGAWIEAVAGFRSDGYAEADAERRADALITEILEAMGNGAEWLRGFVRLTPIRLNL